MPWHRISKGDWAYTSGYWWRVVAMYVPNASQIMVKLERPGRITEALAVGVQRWRQS